ncbi:MAG: type II toxin-antitoxin system VapC family toxin [Promethearchaeota archaeon]
MPVMKWTKIMSYKIVFDSYAWVEYFIGSPMGKFVEEFLEKAEQCYTPSIVIAELSTKFEKENRQKEWETTCKFIRNKTVIIPLDLELANQSGKRKIILRKKAKTIGLADAIIYQTALSLEAILLTGDEHFENFHEVIYLKNAGMVEKELLKLG